MIACLFSGQGSQHIGMGQDLCQTSPAARLIYEEASDFLKLDLLHLDDSQLAQTRYAQSAIVTLSLAAYRAWLEHAAPAADHLAYAGFSLGEYSAMGAAGILDLTDLLALVSERSRLMQMAAEKNPGCMYAILGLDEPRLRSVLAAAGSPNRVFAVNFNAPGQIVIAGLEKETETAAQALKDAGARRTIRLGVSGAFHTPFMQAAAPGLAEFAGTLTFNRSSGPFFSNRTAGLLPDDLVWPAYLAEHLCQPVQWSREVEALAAAGCETMVEFGPGKVLAGLVKKIRPDMPVRAIEDAKSLDEACAGSKS